MITIRQAQLEALAAPFAARFIATAAGHVAALFPEQHAALGAEGTRAAVLHGIERAELHGFASDAEILAYLTLMFVFGRDFDTELEWAVEVLRRRGSSAQRLMHLQSEALFHEAEGSGYGGARNG